MCDAPFSAALMPPTSMSHPPAHLCPLYSMNIIVVFTTVDIGHDAKETIFLGFAPAA